MSTTSPPVRAGAKRRMGVPARQDQLSVRPRNGVDEREWEIGRLHAPKPRNFVLTRLTSWEHDHVPGANRVCW